jgi:diphthine synthase
MHTLCLLDIKVKEPDFEAMMKGRYVFLPPRYMTIHQCCEQLMEAEERHQKHAYNPMMTLCVGLARLGQETQYIKAGTLKELVKEDFGEPLHSLIICGDLHELELEVLKEYLIEGSAFKVENEARIEDEIFERVALEKEDDSTADVI